MDFLFARLFTRYGEAVDSFIRSDDHLAGLARLLQPLAPTAMFVSFDFVDMYPSCPLEASVNSLWKLVQKVGSFPAVFTKELLLNAARAIFFGL